MRIGSLPYRNKDVSIRKGSDIWTRIDGLGWSVSFNHESTFYITVTPNFANRVRGLCGTYNWNQKDDFLTSSGITENNIHEFATSYQTFTDGCTNDKMAGMSECARNPSVMFLILFNILPYYLILMSRLT